MSTSARATSAESPWAQADAAATAAQVTVTMVDSVEGARTVQTVLAKVWPQADGGPPIDSSMLRALSFGGSYVACANDADGAPVGACVGFFGAPGDAHLHSHIAGVVPRRASRGVGRALKLHQRAWALDHGAEEIEWTFDPMVARNAHFNLAQLRAEASTYLCDFYGEMRDERNLGFGSDRLLAVWSLMDPVVVAAAKPRTGVRAAGSRARAGAVLRDTALRDTALRDTAARPPTPWGGHRWIDVSDGTPRVNAMPKPTSTAATDAGTAAPRSTIALPPDIDALRATNPELAAHWRFAVRDAIEGAYASAARIVGFNPTEGYLVEAHRWS
jgi:predicted GNAT superfamily acetyltransferase